MSRTNSLNTKELLLDYINDTLMPSANLAALMQQYLGKHRELLSMFNTLIKVCELTEPHVASFFANGEFYNHASGVIVGELYTYDQFVADFNIRLDETWMKTVLIKRVYWLFEACRTMPHIPESNHTIPSVGMIENVLRTVVNRIYGDAVGDRNYGYAENRQNRSIQAYPELMTIISDIFKRIIISGDAILLFPFTYAIYGMARVPNAFKVNPKHFKMVKGAKHNAK